MYLLFIHLFFVIFNLFVNVKIDIGHGQQQSHARRTYPKGHGRGITIIISSPSLDNPKSQEKARSLAPTSVLGGSWDDSTVAAVRTR